MMDSRGRLGFCLKSRLIGRRCKLTSQQHLYRDVTVQTFLLRSIDNTHATSPDFFKQDIVAELKG